jgi:hypothetical protein
MSLVLLLQLKRAGGNMICTELSFDSHDSKLLWCFLMPGACGWYGVLFNV